MKKVENNPRQAKLNELEEIQTHGLLPRKCTKDNPKAYLKTKAGFLIYLSRRTNGKDTQVAA